MQFPPADPLYPCHVFYRHHSGKPMLLQYRSHLIGLIIAMLQQKPCIAFKEIARLCDDARNPKPANDAHSWESKSIAFQNPLSFGVHSTGLVIEGREKLEDWLAHRETVVRVSCPIGALETACFRCAALYLCCGGLIA